MTLRERLHALYPDASGRAIKQWLEGRRVHVNGVVVRRGDVLVEPHDRVELTAPDRAPFPAPLRLVHEDESLLVVEKPAGLLTIATERERERTAYRLLRDWVSAAGDQRLFVVHRLDRETSGLLVFAKTFAIKTALQAQFQGRAVQRIYVARAEGLVATQEGTLTSRLTEDRSLRVRVARGARKGKEAITRYRVLDRSRDTTLVELSLTTGRRGQIRAQLAALGHPIVGDRAHGSRRDPLRRVCLHATRLGFVHPNGRRVVFESPVPTEWGAPTRPPGSIDRGPRHGPQTPRRSAVPGGAEARLDDPWRSSSSLTRSNPVRSATPGVKRPRIGTRRRRSGPG